MEATASAVPPLAPKLRTQLSVMMFLQYAIWGSWLPIFYDFLTVHRGFTGAQAGTLFAVGAIGAVVAPFIAGQIADRYVNTEKYLGVSHILGGVLVWQLGTIEQYNSLMVFGILYALLYVPTLGLSNSLAFHHLPDRDRDFGRVRVWGTVGWIAVGIGVGQWVLRHYTPAAADAEMIIRSRAAGMADAFKVSAILGWILGAFCFTLPKTPPKKSDKKFAPAQAMGEVKKMPLLALFLISFPVSCIHQFYFVRTSGLLAQIQSDGTKGLTTFFTQVFGVAGGLMTIGQIAELVVLAFMPILAQKLSRKTLLCIGAAAYALRFGIFAYLPYIGTVVPALALHGLCFGCFFFVAFMIVDEETSSDVRASAQGLYNLVIMALGVIAGNFFAGQMDTVARLSDGKTDFQKLFSVPMWIAVACLVALLALYPSKKKAAPVAV